MIPNPGHPSQEQAARAMSQADAFVQQTRQQALQSMQSQHQTYTGGAQPGVLTYAGHGAMMTAGATMRAGQSVISGAATAMGAGASLAQPISQQVMQAGAGARPGLMPQGFFGMLSTAYAPRWLLPHAGMAFGMESAVRREFAQEELGRRWDMFGRRAATAGADFLSLGVTSHLMRRTGMEARIFTEMQTERSLQQRLGVVRGSQYSAATGFGVRRGFLTEGGGAEAMQELMGGAANLQAAFGYSSDQLNTLTQTAMGAITPGRLQTAAMGRGGGMQALGKEISGIRSELARAAREMQMTEEEAVKFFEQLKGTMEVTTEGFRGFREGARQAALSGPFSQAQMGQIGIQGRAMGLANYMDPTVMQGEAFSRANEIAELRRQGVIRSETLLREGGGTGADAMARMLMARMQRQMGAVGAGRANESLILAQANPGAYQQGLQGQGFLGRQGAIAGALIRDPFALRRARQNPSVRRTVAMNLELDAFMEGQRIAAIDPAGQLAAPEIFAQRMGFGSVEEALPQYEEVEARMLGARTRIEQAGIRGDSQQLANFALAFGKLGGYETQAIVSAMTNMQNVQDMDVGGMSAKGLRSAVRRTMAEMQVQAAGRTYGQFAANMHVGGAAQSMANRLLSGSVERYKLPHQARGTVQNAISLETASLRTTQTVRGDGYYAPPELVETWKAYTPERVNEMIGRLRAQDPKMTDEELAKAILGNRAGWDVEEGRRGFLGLGGVGVTRSRLTIKNNKLVRETQRLAMNNDLDRDWSQRKAEIMAGGDWSTTDVEVFGESGDVDAAARLALAATQAGRATRIRSFFDPNVREARMSMRELVRSSPTGVDLLRRSVGGFMVPAGADGTLKRMSYIQGDLTQKKLMNMLDWEDNSMLSGAMFKQRALNPVTGLMRAFSSRGGLEDFAALQEAIPYETLKSVMESYAEGKDINIKAAATDKKGMQKFMSELGGKKRVEFVFDLMKSAIGRSDELARTAPRGDTPENAVWVKSALQRNTATPDARTE